MPLAARRMKVSRYLMLQESFDSEENGGRASQQSGREGCLLAGASARERSWHGREMQLCSSETGLGRWRGCGKVLQGSGHGHGVHLRERETRARGHLALDHHASHVQRKSVPRVTKTQGCLHRDAALVGKSTQTHV